MSSVPDDLLRGALRRIRRLAESPPAGAGARLLEETLSSIYAEADDALAQDAGLRIGKRKPGPRPAAKMLTLARRVAP